MIRSYGLALLLFSAGSLGFGAPLTAQDFQFEYVQNVDPFERFPCSHVQSPVGLFEWDVTCEIGNQSRLYYVHLVVNRYGKTFIGNSAYEILYWVSDATNMTHFKHQSVTLWLHNSEVSNRMNLLEASLGVDQDLASLKLTLLPNLKRK